MDHRVALDDLDEIDLLLAIRQFAMFQEISHIQEIAVFGQLFNRVAAIKQFALVTVDKGDFRLAGCRGQKAGVVGKEAGFRGQGPDIDTIVAMHRTHDRKIDRFAPIDRHCCFTPFCHLTLLSSYIKTNQPRYTHPGQIRRILKPAAHPEA